MQQTLWTLNKAKSTEVDENRVGEFQSHESQTQNPENGREDSSVSTSHFGGAKRFSLAPCHLPRWMVACRMTLSTTMIFY